MPDKATKDLSTSILLLCISQFALIWLQTSLDKRVKGLEADLDVRNVVRAGNVEAGVPRRKKTIAEQKAEKAEEADVEETLRGFENPFDDVV